MAQVVEKKQPETLTDQLRVRFKGVLDPIGAALNRLGITPNALLSNNRMNSSWKSIVETGEEIFIRSQSANPAGIPRKPTSMKVMKITVNCSGM